MNIITEERIVPERRYTETKYIAIDGKEFTTEADCLRHEQYIERIQHPVIKSHISNVMTFDDEHKASLYYLSSEEDFNFLIDCMGFGRRDYIDDNFAQHGAGWYLFFCENDDDYYSSYCIYNLDAYLYDLRLDVNIYENKLRDLINHQKIKIALQRISNDEVSQMNIEMGKVYWQLDDTTATRETLISTLESFGLTAVNERSLGDEFFKRVVDWQSQNGIQFSTIWYVNLCHIRIGEWGGDFADINFDSIVGSYGPFYEHDTIDFMYNGNPMFRMALKRT